MGSAADSGAGQPGREPGTDRRLGGEEEGKASRAHVRCAPRSNCHEKIVLLAFY